MESTTDEVPAKRMRIEGHEKTQIPPETMLEVLLWLDRFDLDGKQITTRRLRSLVENKRMPLRKVHRVDYDDDSDPYKRCTLSIRLKQDDEAPAEVELHIDTDTDAQKAASYLSTCFVSDFNVHGHREALPRNAIIAAPALIGVLDLRECNFRHGAEDTLSATLNGSAFQSLALLYSSNPAWQIDDKQLESLRLRGCNDVHIAPDNEEPYSDTENFEVTEEGILGYCFTLDDGLPVPESRTLRITWTTITPAFFKKVVEASKHSLLTCDVELSLEHLRFDVGNLDLGVMPTCSRPEYDQEAGAYLYNVCYNIADHGNGMRLLIHFKSEHREKWEVVVRHGKKEHEEFFEPTPEEEEFDEELNEHYYALEAYDRFDGDWDLAHPNDDY